MWQNSPRHLMEIEKISACPTSAPSETDGWQASDFAHMPLMNNFRISIISIQLHLRNIQLKRKPSTVKMTYFEWCRSVFIFLICVLNYNSFTCVFFQAET